MKSLVEEEPNLAKGPNNKVRAKKAKEMFEKLINTYKLKPKVKKKSPRYIWSKWNNNVPTMGLQYDLFLILFKHFELLILILINRLLWH